MDLSGLPAVAPAIVSLLGAGASLWGLAQAARRLRVDEGSAAIDGFNALCQQLQARIAASEAEIVTLGEELARLRTENEDLRRKIRLLEHENVQLRAQVDELQQKRPRRRKGA